MSYDEERLEPPPNSPDQPFWGPKVPKLDLNRLPHVEREHFEILWHDLWYDGPYNGMALVDGERLYFQSYGTKGEQADLDETPRHYVFFRLTPEQLKALLAWRDVDRKYSGIHTYFDAEWKKQWSPPHATREAWFEYRRNWPPNSIEQIDLGQSTPVGWYEHKPEYNPDWALLDH